MFSLVRRVGNMNLQSDTLKRKDGGTDQKWEAIPVE